MKNGVQTFPSYTNPSQFHIAGYVAKSYNVNGTTFIELNTANGKTLTITAPKYTDANDLEYQSVLCESVVEHCNGIIDNSIFERACLQVVIL